MVNAEVKRYIRDVLKFLKCSPKARKKSHDNLIFALEDKQLLEQSVTYELCVDQCGTPESVAEEYLSGLSKKELRRFAVRHLVIILVLSSVVLSFLIFLYVKMSNERPGVLIETYKQEESYHIIDDLT